MVRPSRRALLLLTLACGSLAVASAALALPVWSATHSLAVAGHALASGDPATALALSRQGSLTADRRFVEGTALLELNRWGEAATAFSSVVAASDDPDMVRRALHNLALANLWLADESAAGGAGVAARASVAAGREALRLDPQADDSRWNLALAQSLLESNLPEGSPTLGDRGGVRLGGAGGGSGFAIGMAGPMSRDQAEGILDALRSGEVETLRATLARTFKSTRDDISMRGPPW